MYSDVSMMQFAINDQANGSLVHGKFIMTMHWLIQPTFAAILRQTQIPHTCKAL
jgi:hypothetical protein